MSSNFFEALHQIANEKSIPREAIEEIVESAMLSAYKKQYGLTENVKVVFDRSKNSVKIVTKKMVVKYPRDLAEEISMEKAQRFTGEVKLGDVIEMEENPFESFGRIAAQTAKQVIIQKIKEAEKNIIYNEFKDKENELINGYLQRKTKDRMFIDLGKTEGILPAKEQSPLEHYKIGDRIKAIVLNVVKDSKGPNVILSRSHPNFVKKLFEMEIPEVYDEIVTIVNIVRFTGVRTKVAVMSERDDIDSVGACVGMKGVRIQSIVRELEGEKVDVVEYSPDRVTMAANSLTPARVKEVIEGSGGGVIAVVDRDQYNLAVGKGGHNAKLASRLCGFDIDIKTDDQYREFLSSSESRALVEQLFAKKDIDETPLEELGLEPRIIKLLETAGILSVEDLVERSFEDLIKVDGIGEKSAKKIMDIISEVVDFDEEDDDSEEEAVEGGEQSEEPESTENAGDGDTGNRDGSEA